MDGHGGARGCTSAGGGGGGLQHIFSDLKKKMLHNYNRVGVLINMSMVLSSTYMTDLWAPPPPPKKQNNNHFSFPNSSATRGAPKIP